MLISTVYSSSKSLSDLYKNPLNSDALYECIDVNYEMDVKDGVGVYITIKNKGCDEYKFDKMTLDVCAHTSRAY